MRHHVKNDRKKKAYADVVNQNIRHPYKTNDSTKSNTKKQIYPPQKKIQITYENRNANKYPTTNNNKCIQKKMPNPILHNIKPISSKEIKNTNIRKCAHQQAHEKITKNTDTKIRTNPDRIPKNNYQTTSIENKKTKSVDHRNIQFMDKQISTTMKHPYIRTHHISNNQYNKNKKQQNNKQADTTTKYNNK